jgi:hypothetical protein
MEQYEDERWVESFRMSKAAVLNLTELLRLHIAKRDIRYRLAVPFVVRVPVTLFKLAQGSTLLLCSELFVIGRPTVSEILREVVTAVNVVLQHEIKWP